MSTPVEDLDTARLHLRRMTWGDLPAVVAIHSDPATNLHRPGGAPSSGISEQTVRDLVRGWEEHGIGYWVVEFEGKVVGVAGIEPLVFQGRRCWNLYYRFAPEAWGKGFAAEACREAVAVAQALQPAKPVVVRTRPANLRAVQVAERCGLDRRPDLDAEGFAVLALGW
jgi:ribosomal-protein-alanine N-acetyltransferase